MRNVTELSKLKGKVYVYLKNEVVALVVAICAGSVIPVMAKTTTCKESKCKNEAVSGSDYCSLHKCGVSGWQIS